jgi:hypothetical protein
MTMNELMEQILAILPNAVFGEEKTGEIVNTIGGEGMTSSASLRVLSGVRINLDIKKYLATTELKK